MPFLTYFEQIFRFLHAHEDRQVILAAVFILLHVLVMGLRVALHLGFRGQHLMLGADLARRAEGEASKNLRSRLLRRVAAEYTHAASQNPARVPVEAIVDRQLLALSFLGWRYPGLAQLVEKLETGLLLLGLVAALIFSEYAAVYGLLAMAGFVLLKLFAAFFDYESGRQMLRADVLLFVEREVGRDFAGHTSAALLKFKASMAEALDRQSLMLLPLAELSQLAELAQTVEKLRQGNEQYARQHEAFLAQAQAIETSQAALEKALEVYETTLQSLVQTMGDGLGTFVQLHGQKAAAAFNEALQAQMARILEGNQDTLRGIEALVQQFAQQSRDTSAHLRALHEQIGRM